MMSGYFSVSACLFLLPWHLESMPARQRHFSTARNAVHSSPLGRYAARPMDTRPAK